MALHVMPHLADKSYAGVAEDTQMLGKPRHNGTNWAFRKLPGPFDEGWRGQSFRTAKTKNRQQAEATNLHQVPPKRLAEQAPDHQAKPCAPLRIPWAVRPLMC